MAIYGVKFAQAWAGVDPNEMKRAWAQRLSAFDPHQVGRAIEQCEMNVKTPPTLPQFVEIIRSCHVDQRNPQLTYTRPMPTRTEAELQASREYPKPKDGLGTFWAKRIVRLEQLGERQTAHPLRCAMNVLGLTDISQLTERYPPA